MGDCFKWAIAQATPFVVSHSKDTETLMVRVISFDGLLDPRLRKSCRGSGSHERVKINDMDY